MTIKLVPLVFLCLIHVVDRNASGTAPSRPKFLVLLIKDKGPPALVPAQ